MSKERSVYLNELGEWLLYRAMVCHEIVNKGMLDMIDCDPWEFSESLDMSFEEVRKLPLELWGSKIAADAEEMRNEIVKH